MTPLIDCEEHIVAILARHPSNPGWVPLHIDVADFLKEVRKKCDEKKKCGKRKKCGERKKKGPERRGRFKTMRCGISHGGGQTHPRNHSNTKKDQMILDWLNDKEAFD